MTAALVLADDERAQSFEPFALTRPVSELLLGIASTRERWEQLLQIRCSAFTSGAHLVEFREAHTPAFLESALPAGSIVANSRFAPSLMSTAALADSSVSVWRGSGHLAAIRTRDPLSHSAVLALNGRLDRISAASGETADIDGVWLEEVWDLIRLLPAQLASDISRMGALDAGGNVQLSARPASVISPFRLREQLAVVGDAPVIVAADAVLDPYVVLDARNGPILVASGARVAAFSRLEGPAFIGQRSAVLGGRVVASAIGEECRVAGEVNNIVMLGYSNKAHDGFIGHSYLGKWVNLGAGTTTSNLKNTYGAVSIWTPSGNRITDLQFLGTFFGDHARTGIGTLLATGSVLGAGANVFGGGMPPRYVPPFSWGGGSSSESYRLSKFLEVAERVMGRRKVALTESERRHLQEVYRVAHVRDEG